jgi:hypothetical protein
MYIYMYLHPHIDIAHGYLIGAVKAKEAMNVQKSSNDTTKVEELMIPKDELIVMRSNALAG